MQQQIRRQLERNFSKELLDRLFESYQLINENYYFGKYRPCCAEGGRFSEAAIRMLQEITTRTYTPLGKAIPNFSNEVLKLEKTNSQFPQSVRVQIPRTLQVVYDIRNKRDVGHIGGDVDSNFTDATLTLLSSNWVMTELIRIYYTSSIDVAQNMVNSIIKIRIPLIQDFNGFLKILKPDLKLPEKILALLYCRGSEGASTKELKLWLSNRVRTDHMNLTLDKLENERAFVHREGDCYKITDTGSRYAVKNIPFTLDG
jgi:hypothetical protein